jgi:calcineurin-like phosphoesterase family protein
MRFFTADQHFGHPNILKYEAENRRNAHGGQFPSIEKMDKYLVDQWNATVAPGDQVYCLGDFSFKQSIMETIVPRLHGEKILIVGNHDPFYKRLTRCQGTKMRAEAIASALQAGFSAVHLQLEIEVPGIGLVRLSHFPYLPNDPLPDYEQSHAAHWGKPQNEALLLHGHIHSQWLKKTEPGIPPMINVGVDVWKMRPVSEAEIIERFSS